MIDRDQYWYERAKIYAYELYMGDNDSEILRTLLEEDGFIDKNQEWVNE